MDEKNGIPSDIRQFVYDCIDSVEQLEVLLLLRDQQRWWTAKEISDQMRSSVPSVEKRLHSLRVCKLLEQSASSAQEFKYRPVNPETDMVVAKLAQEYRLRRPALLRMIFSPLKSARNFANAFILKPPGEDGEDNA